MSQIIKKSQTKTIQENPSSIFHEYPVQWKNLAVGIAEINGRYPSSGFAVDEKIEQVSYVASGTGTIWLDNHETEISSGDIVKIDSGEKYWIKAENLKYTDSLYEIPIQNLNTQALTFLLNQWLVS